MKLIAIIPAYNEESTIGDVIKSTSRFVDEILVINDGSTDQHNRRFHESRRNRHRLHREPRPWQNHQVRISL